MDLFRARVRSLFQNRFIQLFYCGLGLLVFWSGTRGEAANAPILVRIFGGILVAIMFVIIGFAITIPLLLAGTFKRNTGILCDHEIELKEEGLVERTEANETLHRWAAFHKVSLTRGGLYIYVTDTQIHIIPRRFFANAQQMREFQLDIERRVSEAKGREK